MNIGIDVDNTLVNLAGAVHRLWNIQYPTDPKPRSAFFSWQASSDLGIKSHRFFEMLKESWTLWPSLMYPMDQGACYDIANLRGAGHKVHIITNRDLANHKDVLDFLEMQRIEYDAFTIVNRGGLDKLSFPIDVLIDDHPKMGTEAARYPTKRVLLYDQPWNREIEQTANLTRVPSLRHAVDIILGEG